MRRTLFRIAPTHFNSWYRAALDADDWKNGGFGLYIHWPFCQAKCPYCDFNSHVSSTVDTDHWLRVFKDQLEKYADETSGRTLQSIFFGGGTPSLMPPSLVREIINTVQRLWRWTNDIEITLEANPTSVEADRFTAFKDGGVNRISLGVQALVDDDLRRLGRLHDSKAALYALEIAQNTFDRVSFDLIYGRQDQSQAMWEKELSYALTLGTDHLSLYQLTIEPNTAFGDRYRAGKLQGLPSDDLSADMYDMTQALCLKHGLPAYEVSNHASPGSESRHNLVYWRYGDYVGVGPGAHGRLTMGDIKFATEHSRSPAIWLNSKQENHRNRLSKEEAGEEMLLMGLRLVEGIKRSRFESLSGLRLCDRVLNDLVDEGWIEHDVYLRVKPKGFVVLNAIIDRIISSAYSEDSLRHNSSS